MAGRTYRESHHSHGGSLHFQASSYYGVRRELLAKRDKGQMTIWPLSRFA